MKRAIYICAILLTCTLKGYSRLHIGIEGGLTSASSNSGEFHVAYGYGLKAGILGDITLFEHKLYLQTGLYFWTDASKMSYTTNYSPYPSVVTSKTYNTKTQMIARDIPVMFFYKLKLKKSGNLFLGAGAVYTKMSITEDIGGGLSGSNLGLGLAAGYQFERGFFIKAGMQTALMAPGSALQKYNSISLTVGRLFMKHRTAKGY